MSSRQLAELALLPVNTDPCRTIVVTLVIIVIVQYHSMILQHIASAVWEGVICTLAYHHHLSIQPCRRHRTSPSSLDSYPAVAAAVLLGGYRSLVAVQHSRIQVEVPCQVGSWVEGCLQYTYVVGGVEALGLGSAVVSVVGEECSTGRKGQTCRGVDWVSLADPVVAAVSVADWANLGVRVAFDQDLAVFANREAGSVVVVAALAFAGIGHSVEGKHHRKREGVHRWSVSVVAGALSLAPLGKACQTFHRRWIDLPRAEAEAAEVDQRICDGSGRKLRG